MVKIENKLKNFTAANKRLHEAVTAYKNDPNNTLYRDALIQRFEFTFELAWKTIAAVLTEQGIKLTILSPKAVIKEAYNAGYITDEEIWLRLLEDRNLMSHTYDEATAAEIAANVCRYYSKELNVLLNSLSKK